jgi:hypothetical protein
VTEPNPEPVETPTPEEEDSDRGLSPDEVRQMLLEIKGRVRHCLAGADSPNGLVELRFEIHGDGRTTLASTQPVVPSTGLSCLHHLSRRLQFRATGASEPFVAKARYRVRR